MPMRSGFDYNGSVTKDAFKVAATCEECGYERKATAPTAYQAFEEPEKANDGGNS